MMRKNPDTDEWEMFQGTSLMMIDVPIGSMYGIFTYVHLVDFYGKCR